MAEWHNVWYKIVRNQDAESTQMPPWQSPSWLVTYNNKVVTSLRGFYYDTGSIRVAVDIKITQQNKVGLISYNTQLKPIKYIYCKIYNGTILFITNIMLGHTASTRT